MEGWWVWTVDDFGGKLRAAKGGDEEAFAVIWRTFNPPLLRYVRVKATPVAEDVVAETWLRAIQSLPTFEGDEAGFRAWLYTTARNLITDWYRVGPRRPFPVETSTIALFPARTSVETEVDERSGTDAALAVIAVLPADQAEAVLLRIVAGLDVSAVAKIMQRSTGAVRVLCHRGLRRLESLLEQGDPEEPASLRLRPVVNRDGDATSATAGVANGRGVLHG
jgi:RNA polymerase sigma-70 factor, ECF subfamily